MGVEMWKGAKAFESFRVNPRTQKPRERGVTEVRDRGMGMHALEDLCESACEYIDILKIYCGVQRLQPREFIKRKIDFAREYGIEYSTGGMLERVLLQGPDAVYAFLEEARDLGFAEVEVSSGILSLPLDHKLDIIRLVKEYGLKAKPEVGMAYGTLPGEETNVSADKIIHEVKRCLEVGADKVMIEEEGLTENVPEWRTDVIFKLTSAVDLNDLMFEASEIPTYTWYIKNFGAEVNLFVDDTQLLHLEVQRQGIWGKTPTWGRVATFARR